MDNSERRVQELRKELLRGNRVALGKALTLVESSLQSDQQSARRLIEDILPNTGQSLRIGITGVPGVGKSTFIEVFGKHIIDQGNKVAVLTIDPSSQLTGGSILGDKTRMPDLSRNEAAFIRPTASGSALGGVAMKTRESILLCEAAGYNVIIVETVGVGQSEIAIRNMVDFFLLLMLAGAGDELQGIKKGIMEMADAILITKADGENLRRATEAQAEYKHALHLIRHHEGWWQPQVTICSSQENKGIAETWQLIREFHAKSQENGEFINLRKKQRITWINERFDYLLKAKLYEDELVKKKKIELEREVLDNKITPFAAADLLAEFALGSLRK